jgi:predicted RNase H-like nuclease (RuvC/YqgF family)
MISSRTPAIVATDNMYELAADKPELIRFLEALPAQTRLVQVTGGTRPEPLSRVAGRHGVPYEKRPMAEAEAAARLAAANVGAVVRAFTDTTRVKVARGRSIGKGGWSEDRYVRKIHGAVRRRARALAESLDAAGLEYHVEVTEKYGGYANAVFTVSAPPAEIPLTAGRQGDVRVEISRERRDGIEFEPLVTRRDPIIVGVDPGTTTAAAAVGLDGTLHATYSSRTDDAGALTRWIIDQGRPLIVAADVARMPETVEKQRRGGGGFRARAQHVRRPDIARADPAQVAQPHQPRQYHAEGDRPQQVAKSGPEREQGGGGFDERHQAASWTGVPAT